MYHVHQYVGNYMLIYFGIFFIPINMFGLQVDIFYYFSAFLSFFSVFLLRKIWPGNVIIFQHNFYLFLL